jgi:hypothetical protein
MPQSGRCAQINLTTTFFVERMTKQHFAESFAVSTTASKLATVRERYCMSFQRFLESAHLDRQKPVGRVHEIDRQRCRLKFIEQSREGSALVGCLEVIGEVEVIPMPAHAASQAASALPTTIRACTGTATAVWSLKNVQTTGDIKPA